jgi:putative colanic acid biosynthesis acetyltransferase WcaB
VTIEQLRMTCRRDLAANKGYPKSVVVLVAFRVAQYFRSRRGLVGRIVYVPVGTAYKLFSEWLLGIEIPASTSIGPGLILRHGVGIVINPSVVIGADVMIRQNVTLGNRLEEHDCPVIEDGVELGAGAVVIGRVTVGAGARIGAGAVVVKDVPPGGVAINTSTEIRPGQLPRT